VDVITSLGLRMIFAVPMFIVMALWGQRSNATPLREHLGGVLVLGFTGYYLASTLDFLGLALISASLERLILYVSPTLVLVFARLRGGPPIRTRQWVGMLISYAGVLTAFGTEAFRTTAVVDRAPHEVLLGTALVLGSAASFAVYIALSGELVLRFGALRLAGLASIVASVLCIVQFLVLRPQLVATVDRWMTPRVFGLSLLNATVCTAMPMWMVMRGIQIVGSGEAAQIGMIGPLSTMLLAVILLGEHFTLPLVAGTVLVLLGITWLTRR
jgi:drug/metabolite transporter (DMT)-like permease